MPDPLVQKTINGILARINADPNVTKYNRNKITEMLAWQKATGGRLGKGADEKTIQKYLYCMERFLRLLNRKVDFDKITQKDMVKVIGKLNDSDYSDWVKVMVKIQICHFWKHFYGTPPDVQMPPVVSWIKIGRPPNKLEGSDLLTEEEIQRLVDAAKTERDKSLLAVGYDLGLRVGEMKVKVKNVNTNEGYIDVDGKTGKRRAWSSGFCIPYLRTYMTNAKKKPEEYLWTDYTGNQLTCDAIYMILKRAAADAKLGKKVWWHLLRHSRVTHYINKKVPISAMLCQFGWSKSSNVMQTTYSHLTDGDTHKLLLEAEGEILPDRVEASKLKPVKCGFCGALCGGSSKFCNSCGRALSLEYAQDIENAQKAMTNGIQNKDLNKKIEEMSRQIVALQKKAKK